MNIKEKYTCICCGYKTLGSDEGYAVCVLCGWEDDPISWEEPQFKGGPNGLENLFKQQKRIIRQGLPYHWKIFREEHGYEENYEVDKHWEPFQEDYVDFRFKNKKSKGSFIWMFRTLGYKEYEQKEREKNKTKGD